MKKVFIVVLAGLGLVMLGCNSKPAEGRDGSVYSAANISGMSIAEPEKALALLDTAEREKLMSDFDINRLRTVVYHNGWSDNIQSLQYALKAYDAPSARDNVRTFLRLIEMISDQYYLNGDYPQSIRFCTEGIKLAQDSLVRNSEANLTFNLGRNLLYLSREEEGFRYYRKAVDILDEEAKLDATWETTDDYIYTLAILIGTLRNEGYLDEAIALLPRYEEAVRRLETKAELPDGLLDVRLASGYGMAAYLYAVKGDKAEAHQQYLKLCATDYAQTPDASQLIIPYLVEIGNLQEALQCLQEEKRYWQANADTVSYSYIQNHLETELAVYEELGDLRAANRILHTIQQLGDTLRARDTNAKALELAEMYKTNEQAIEIERQSASIRVRNVVIVSVAVFLLLAVWFIVRMLRYNRDISRKNAAMVKTIDELMGYKDEVFARQEEILLLRQQLQGRPQADGGAPDASTVQQAAGPDVDRMLFDRMNHEILAQRLFLKPDFSKKDLLAEFRIPANKFSSLFKQFAHCSFPQYIQNCRLDYAVRLLKEQPQWSLEAIAKEAGMSNGAFYSQFKKKFGMSPSDFKAGEAIMTAEGD